MIIIGAGEFAQIIQHYTGAEMCVHRKYAKPGMKVFEELPQSRVLICIGDNHKRREVMGEAIDRNHRIACWVHPSMWKEPRMDIINTFVFEGNDIQPFATVGMNTVLWANNHIGHHARIGASVFITSHVCIGGGAEIGDYSFIGMNATVFDHVKIGKNCTIAAGAVVDRDIPDNHTLSRKGILLPNAPTT